MSEYHCFSMKETKARKKHRCVYCGQIIAIGEMYLREKSIYEGWRNFQWHPECLEAQREYAKDGDWEFTLYSADRPEKISAEVKP